MRKGTQQQLTFTEPRVILAVNQQFPTIRKTACFFFLSCLPVTMADSSGKITVHPFFGTMGKGNGQIRHLIANIFAL